MESHVAKSIFSNSAKRYASLLQHLKRIRINTIHVLVCLG